MVPGQIKRVRLRWQRAQVRRAYVAGRRWAGVIGAIFVLLALAAVAAIIAATGVLVTFAPR